MAPKTSKPAIDAKSETTPVEKQPGVAFEHLAQNAAIITQGPTDLAEFDYGDRAGEGMDSLSARLMKLPFGMLVQSGTPGQNERGNPFYQKAGYFYDPISGEFHDGETGLQGVIIRIVEEYVERTPEKDGRKFVGKHTPNSEFVKLARAHTAKMDNPPFGKLWAPNGNTVTETHSCYGVWQPIDKDGNPTGDPFMMILPVKSSGIPALQQWATGVRMNRRLPNGATFEPGRGPTLYGYLVRVTAEHTKKDSYSWHKLIFRPVGGSLVRSIQPLSSPWTKQGIALTDGLKTNAIKVDESTFDAATGGDEVATEGGVAPKDMEF